MQDILQYLNKKLVLGCLSSLFGIAVLLSILLLNSPEWPRYSAVGQVVFPFIFAPLLGAIIYVIVQILRGQGQPNLQWNFLLPFAVIPAVISLVLASVVTLWAIPTFNNLRFHLWDTETITDRIQLTGNSSMTNGAEALAILPETQHQHLRIVFMLDNPESTGTCVASSKLTIAPIINGVKGTKTTSVGSGQNAELDNIMAVKKLAIVLDQEDSYCKLNLTVQSASYSQ